MFIECLVFLESETAGYTIAAGSHNPRSASSNKYVLFPSALKNHRLCGTLRQGGFQVHVSPPGNRRFVFFEMLVEEKPDGEQISLYIDNVYHPLLERLLGKRCRIQSYSKCRASQVLSAVDEENLAVIEKFLLMGADIWYSYENESGSLLHFAAKDSEIALIKLLLEKGANPNAKMGDCSTALHISTQKNDVEAVRLLLEKNADTNATTIKGVTPLHVAAEHGLLQMVDLLLRSGADLRVRMIDGSTPLHTAVIQGHEKVVEHMLRNGVVTDSERKQITDARMTNNMNCLCYALTENKLKIARLLLQYSADPNAIGSNGVTPLHVAVKKGLLEMVKLLIYCGADLNIIGNCSSTPLHTAVFEGYVEIMEHLLLHGFNPDLRENRDPRYMGATSLHVAIIKGRAEIVALLLKKGADVNAELHDGRSALHLAVTTNQVEICELLCRYDPAMSNDSNRKAFYSALSERGAKYRQIVLCLLKYGLDVNADDADDPRLLFGAIYKNMHSIVEKLLNFGASAQSCEAEGQMLSLLHIAARRGDEDMVQLLVRHGANVNAVIDGRSPVSVAIQYSNVKTFEALLTSNADVKDPSLLHLAFEYCPKFVQRLLEHGTDVNSRNSEERTLLCVAAFTGNLEIINILSKFGARASFKDIAPQNVRSSDHFQVFLDYGFTEFDCESEINFQKFLYRFGYYSKFRECVEKLASQIVKMIVAHESVDPPIPARLYEKLKLREFKESCEMEIVTLKLEVIPDTEVSFYSILTKKTQQVANYTRNERFVKTLEAINLKEKFPIYASVLECQIRKGIVRRQIINDGIKLLRFLFSWFFELPHELKEKIVNYLTNQDVLMLNKCLNHNADH